MDYDEFDNFGLDDYYGGVDDLTFQISGYGGFGYDTSHVEKPQKETAVVQAARSGNVSKLKSLLGSAKDDNEKRRLLNEARRWTEVDYKMSGFTKEYEWYDLTPLAHAAKACHVEAVLYLLQQGADPTLSGCPTDDVYYTAAEAAEAGYKVADLKIIHASKPSRKCEQTLHEYADRLFKELENAKRCQKLIEAASAFWKKASYACASYDDQRGKSGYSNAPTDKEGLLKALDETKMEEVWPAEELAKLAKRKEDLVMKLTGIQASSSPDKKKSKPRKMQPARKRHETRSFEPVIPLELTVTHRGKVKWYSKTRGFGFITSLTDGDDIFVHRTGINAAQGSQTLSRGELVAYQVEGDASGRPKAVQVTKLLI